MLHSFYVRRLITTLAQVHLGAGSFKMSIAETSPYLSIINNDDSGQNSILLLFQHINGISRAHHRHEYPLAPCLYKYP
jgi:hypothetical protein